MAFKIEEFYKAKSMRLARDRWYSRDGQRQLQRRAHHESMGTRKIIGLVLLLMMILVVMRQLTDPQKYEPAFRAIGLTQTMQFRLSASKDGNHPPSQVTGNPTNGSSSDELSGALNQTENAKQALQTHFLIPESPSVELFMQMWQRLFETASPEVVAEFAKIEFSVSPFDSNNSNNKDKSVEDRLPLPQLSKAAIAWLDTARVRVEGWETEYQSILDSNPGRTPSQEADLLLGSTFVTQWLAWARFHTKGVSAASSALDHDLRAGLRLAFDRTLLGFFRDSMPWRSQERPALARTFLRALANVVSDNPVDPLAIVRHPRQIPLVEVLSLSKQTNDYRGQTVRLRGQPVTNPESATQDVPGWGRFQYDIVWVRPNDYSQQLVCVYSLRAPSGGWPLIRSAGASKSTSQSTSTSASPLVSEGMDFADTPLAEFSGILVKRLAYPSQRGVDVAPVLIVFDVRWMSDASRTTSPEPSIPIATNRTRRWIEPGEQATNLQLLRDVFASDLESLSDEATQSKLTEKEFLTDTATEMPQLVQILYQLPRVERPLTAAIATHQNIGPTKLDTFEGWVKEIKAIQQPRAVSASGEPMTIYRLHLEPNADRSNSPLNHYAFVNQVPAKWKSLTKLSQPISLSGMYWETTTASGVTRCWIADHVNWSWPWLANSETSIELLDPTISDDWMKLGAVGFDLSRVDLLGSLREKPISVQESQPFYSIIDCADRMTPKETFSTNSILSVIDCLDKRNVNLLRRVRTKVHIVRATRISVSDPYHQEILGAQAYYELDGLAKLGNVNIQMNSPDNKEHIFFQGEYPITLISKHLPSWLARADSTALDLADLENRSDDLNADSTPLVWYPRTTIDVEGIFYRLWSFTTTQTSSFNKPSPVGGTEAAPLRQFGPLVAVTHWGNRPSDDASDPNRSIYKETLMAAGIAAICIYGYYRLSQTTKRRKA